MLIYQEINIHTQTIDRKVNTRLFHLKLNLPMGFQNQEKNHTSGSSAQYR